MEFGVWVEVEFCGSMDRICWSCQTISDSFLLRAARRRTAFWI